MGGHPAPLAPLDRSAVFWLSGLDTRPRPSDSRRRPYTRPAMCIAMSPTDEPRDREIGSLREHSSTPSISSASIPSKRSGRRTPRS
jgi:hypothetical protein